MSRVAPWRQELDGWRQSGALGRVFWGRQAEFLARQLPWLSASVLLLFTILLAVDAAGVGGAGANRMSSAYIPGRIFGVVGALLAFLSSFVAPLRGSRFAHHRLMLLCLTGTLGMAHASLVTFSAGGSPGTFVLLSALTWGAMPLPPVWAAVGSITSGGLFIAGLVSTNPGPLSTSAFETAVNACILSVLAVLARDFLTRRDFNLFRSQQELEQARRKSEELLLSVLPADIVRELKQEGVSRPRLHPMVSVMFADLVGFSRYAERMDPELLVLRLDALFTAFDGIARRHGLEKLKTIGDCYMCAGGLLRASPDHVADCVAAALDFVEVMKRQPPIHLPGQEPRPLGIRIGVHCGPVVAGVIGEEKFLYDIWGDTVNAANRVENLGAPGCVTVSREVRDRILHRFECEPLGTHLAKHQREIELWRVVGPGHPEEATPVTPG